MDISKQSVRSNGIGIQAGESVNITNNNITNNNGLNFTEVREIVDLLFEKNFPELAEKASQEALRNVNFFFESFKKEIEQKLASVDFDKLSDPNLQYLLNQAVISSARKGEKSNITILAKLLTERMTRDKSSLLDLISEAALPIVPSLSSTHLDFLSYICFMSDMFTSSPGKGMEILDIASPIVKEFTKSGFAIDTLNWEYLESLNLVARAPTEYDRWLKNLLTSHPILNGKSEEQIIQILEQSAPVYHSMLVNYRKKGYNGVRLTTVGKLIAFTNLKSVVDVNIDSWANAISGL